MIRLYKVTENSLAPLYNEGDFAITSRIPFFLSPYPAPGSTVVFRQKYYGVMIKRVERIVPEEDEIYVIGTHESSVDSRSFGPIHRSDLLGKVIWHIRKPEGAIASPIDDTAAATRRKAPVSPYLAIFFGILAVSTASLFIRFAQAYNTPSLVIAAYRLSLASLILAPVALFRYRAELNSLSRRDLFFALLSGVFLAFHFALWITSLEATSVASSVVLVTTAPLWVALFAPFTIKERITPIIVTGLLLALAGSTIVGFSDACTWTNGSLACPSLPTFFHDKAFIADLFALGGAVMAACYVLIGRGLRSRMSLIPYIFVVYGMAALALIVFMLASGKAAFGYPPAAYLWLILLAVVPQLIGHSIFNFALGYLPAAFVSITLMGEPIGSTILAYFLLHEKPTAMKLIGAILILTGILVASKNKT